MMRYSIVIIVIYGHYYVRFVLHKCSGPEVITLFLSSAQLSMKFQLLINVEIVEISGKLGLSTQQLVIYPAYKC